MMRDVAGEMRTTRFLGHPERYFAVIALLALVSGCSPSPRVSVTNLSPQALSNLVVSGSGFSQRVPVLEPGQRMRWRVEPSGESGLSLRFDAAGRTVDSGKQGYFEPRGRYEVDAVKDYDEYDPNIVYFDHSAGTLRSFRVDSVINACIPFAPPEINH